MECVWPPGAGGSEGGKWGSRGRGKRLVPARHHHGLQSLGVPVHLQVGICIEHLMRLEMEPPAANPQGLLAPATFGVLEGLAASLSVVPLVAVVTANVHIEARFADSAEPVQQMEGRLKSERMRLTCMALKLAIR